MTKTTHRSRSAVRSTDRAQWGALLDTQQAIAGLQERHDEVMHSAPAESPLEEVVRQIRALNRRP